MNSRRSIWALIVVLAFLGAMLFATWPVGCGAMLNERTSSAASPPSPFDLLDSERTAPWERVGYKWYRAIDKEAGVICWVTTMGVSPALHCLPLADTMWEE